MGEVCFFCPLCKGVHYFVNVLRGEFVVVRHLDALGRSINEQHFIVRFTLFQHHDAGGNTGTKEQVARQLDDTVNEVVVHQIFADFLFCTATVHNAGETDDCCRAVGSQPCQRVHDKRQIRFALRSQHTSRSKTRVIDEQRILVTGPLDGVRRIRYDQLKGFIIPVLRICQRILTGNVEFVKLNVVQEHIDTAQVIRCDVDFLPKEAITHSVPSQHLFCLQ